MALDVFYAENVSIHAPLRREERRNVIGRELAIVVSIHAPLRREERLSAAGKGAGITGFNPRPPPERGATL